MKPITRKQKAVTHKAKLRKQTQRGDRPYAPNWHGVNGVSVRTRTLTGNLCICCMKQKATLTHHFYYLKLLFFLFPVKIYGREVSGLDCGGVCDGCHGWLHDAKSGRWIYGKDPDSDRNSPKIITQLRFNFFTLLFWTRFRKLVVRAILLVVALTAIAFFLNF